MSDLVARLDSFIEYAEATKKFADIGFYNELKAELTNLKALNKELTDVLAKLDIEFIGLKAELEAYKEVVAAIRVEYKGEQPIQVKVCNTFRAETARDEDATICHDITKALEKLNKDN